MAIDIGRVGVWNRSSIWADADPGERREAIAELDELGYGAAWFGMAETNLPLFEELLAASKRIVVATGILNVWRIAPADAAAWYNGIAAAYPGRFLLGLGIGHPGLVAEYRQPMEKLLEYFDELDAVEPTVPVDQRIIAALRPRALRFAAARSLGAHPYLVTPEHTRQAREALGPEALLAPEQKVVLETDPVKARAAARSSLAVYLDMPNYINSLLHLGFTPDDVSGEGSDRLVDGLVAWGDVDTVAARVAEHHAAGADHVSIQVLGDPLPLRQWRDLAAALKL